MLTGRTAARPRALVDKGGPQVPRKRRLLVFVLAALAGAAVVVMPALAGTEGTPAVEAFNGSGPYGEQSHEWRPPSVTIAPGGAITISNPTNVAHGVEWRRRSAVVRRHDPRGQYPGELGHPVERNLHASRKPGSTSSTARSTDAR